MYWIGGLEAMNAVKWAGVAVFLVGIVIMGVYSMYPLFYQKVEESTILFGMKISLVLMGIGAAILIITMSIERYKDWKKMKEEISEEDLRP
ncbi:MAG TPA: hypothetical protein VMW40_00770 [Candidatus Bathyarchaeia archaeon]|nr:hypothetical protein [Candidatus Bathyarchaeia archaeon]